MKVVSGIQLFIIFLTLGLISIFSVNAEVQGVKIGGEMEIRGIWQEEFDLNSSIRGESTPTGRGADDGNIPCAAGATNSLGLQGKILPGGFNAGTLGGGWYVGQYNNVYRDIQWLVGRAILAEETNAVNYNPDNFRLSRMATVNAQVTNDASVQDWTDIYNLRVWASASLTDNTKSYVRFRRRQQVWGEDPGEVAMELAYLDLAEIYDSAVSLRIGKQKFYYGEGFLVGRKGITFDAIKAGWKSKPHKIDFFLSKMGEDYSGGEDQDFYGIDYNCNADKYGVYDIGLFHLYQHRDNILVDPTQAAGSATNPWVINSAGNTSDAGAENMNGETLYGGRDETTSLFVRGERKTPWITAGTLALKGEIVKQWGRVATLSYMLVEDPNNERELLAEGGIRTRRAWGGYAEGKYTFATPYEPYFSLGHVYMSGDKNNKDSVVENSGTIETFDPMFEDKEYGELADGIRGGIYADMTRGCTWAGEDNDGITNAKIWKISSGFKPGKNFLIDLTYYNFRQDQPTYVPLTQEYSSKDVGGEYVLSLEYDYTKEVTFKLHYAQFNPGSYWEDVLVSDEFNDSAREIQGSVKIKF